MPGDTPDLDAAMVALATLEARLTSAAQEADATWSALRARAEAFLSGLQEQPEALAAEPATAGDLPQLRETLTSLSQTAHALVMEAGGTGAAGGRALDLAPALVLGLEAVQETARRLQAKAADVDTALGGMLDETEALLRDTAAEIEAFGEEAHQRALGLLDMLERESYPLIAQSARSLEGHLSAAHESLRQVAADTSGTAQATAGQSRLDTANELRRELEDLAFKLEDLARTIRAFTSNRRIGFEGERGTLAEGTRDLAGRLRSVLQVVGQVEELLREQGLR